MHEQRALLDAACRLITDLEMLPEDLPALEAVRRQLDELFLVVVVGEFNSGKSTFLNALLGTTLLEMGELPTTRHVHLLRFGPVRSEREAETGLIIHELPVSLLEDLNVVDTPGTNSMQRAEQALTEGFVPRADLVFFLTSLVRPYTASEHEFLTLIKRWGKQIVFVVNQIDLASGPEHVQRVRRYVQEQAYQDLGGEHPVYAISASEVLQGGKLSATNEWCKLEEWITSTLRQRERVLLKLRSPLDSLVTVLSRQEEALAERQRLVVGDRAALEEILAEVAAYEKRMTEDVSRYQSQITNILWQFERRGQRFFDELVRFSNLLRLRNTDIVENRFRSEVVGTVPQQIEAEVQALIDWLVRQNLAIWQRTDDMLQRRREVLREAAGRTRWFSKEWVYNREEIFAQLAEPVKRRLDAFDARDEADAIVAAVNHAIAKTFGVQALVIGVGAVLTAAFTSLTLDVTGAIGATILAVAGLFILPHRRGRLKRELAEKIELLRVELGRTLETRFHEQLRQYVVGLREAFEPERDATVTQQERLQEAGAQLRGLFETCRSLRQRVG